MLESITQSVRFYHDPIAFLSECQSKHGDYYRTQLGLKRIHFIFEPTLARSILSDPLTFVKARFVYDKIKPITGNSGIVQIEGEEGLKLRNAFNRFFQREQIERYLISAREVVERTASQLIGNRDIRSPATELVLQTALSMFAGAGLKTKTKDLTHQFLRLNDLCAREFKNLLPIRNPLRHTQIQRLRKSLDLSISEIITTSTEPCLIQSIREAEAEIPRKVSDVFILDQVKTFLFAGHETTATYLIMALFELARNPELQDKIHRDLTSEKPNTETTRRFLREILRLYSPAWMLVRESTSEGALHGHPYQKGDYFFSGTNQIHRHPQHWHAPETLCLDHHENNNIAFMPYGFGKRHCIGSRLADLELQMILAVVLRQFRLEYLGSQTTIRPEVMITAYPADPLEIRFTKRS
jgi:cytochrome P450